LSLVREGLPEATIVVATDAPETVVRAARELRDYVERSTGARLLLLEGRRPDDGASIFVGASRFTRRLGISTDGMGPDGYCWRTGHDWLAIVGRDHRGGVVHGMRNPWRPHEVYNTDLKLGAFGESGTLYGVYHLLERVLGVRWFMPGPLGTVVPKRTSVMIPDLNVVRQPDFEYRYPWFCNFSIAPEEARWYRRVGYGGACPVQAIHSFRMFLKYKDDHPDWFALVDGQRDFGSLCCVTGRGNLCLSNTGLLQQMAADIRAYFDSHPSQRFFPVAPNDGMTRVCECDRCAPQVEEDQGKWRRFSNYIWGFVDLLAGEVARTHPGRFIGTIAYEGYLEPPDRIDRLHPNVAVMICQTRGSFADLERRQRVRRRIEAWSQKTDRIYLWEYYRYNLPPFPWCPVAYPHLIREDLGALKGISKGEFIEAESWGRGQESRLHYPALQHLNLYVTAKCLWDAELDVDALLRDYYISFYGPAAGPMRAFWEKAEALHCAKPTANPVIKYSITSLDQLLALLSQARDRTAPDTDYRQRVEKIRADVQKLRETLSSALVSGRRQLTAHRADSTSRVDGRLDEPFWRRVRPQAFVLKNGEAPPYRSWVAVAHDDTHLRFAIVNVEPELGSLRALAGPDNPEAGIWDDDCIEVFVAPDAGRPAKAFQIIVNAAGVTWDGAYGLPKPGPGLFGCQPAWYCDGLHAAVAKTRSRWIVELAIPLSSIGLDGDRLPQQIAMNVYRCRSCGAGPVYSAWSPPLLEQHYAPQRFGRLTFDRSPAPPPDLTRFVPRSENDVGSGAASGPGWYKPGGILSGKPFVGNPNTLTRRDRMVIRFDLAPLALHYGDRGVTEAILRLIPIGVSGADDRRRLELAHLLYDTGALSWKDVVSDRAAVAATVEAPRSTVCQTGLAIDVTTQVNADLTLGRPAVAFRLRDLGSEEGNPDMKPDGLCFPDYRSGNLRLEVRPQ